MTAPGTSTCEPWATIADLGSPCDDYAIDTVLVEDALQVASDVLYNLTGRQWPGECSDVIRPCGFRQRATRHGGYGWQGGCGCLRTDGCGCRRLSELRLPGVVAGITAVTIDGAVLDPDRYRVDDWRTLVYLPESDDAERQGWPCFPAGTLVLTSTGLRSIETVVAGDLVLTHRNRWKRVTRAGQTGVSETVTVSGRGGAIRCTPDHQFWASEIFREGPACGKYPLKLGAPAWTDAAMLVGCAWATPRAVAPLPVPLPHGDLPPNFWWFVGRWVGDGWTDNNRVVLCAGAHEADQIDSALAATKWQWRKANQRTGPRWRVTDAPLAQWLRAHFGTSASTKTLPAWMLGADAPVREAFLEGYVSADGWRPRPKDGRGPFTSVHTVSRTLAQGVRLLAASLGFAPMSYEGQQSTTHIEGRPVHGRPTYRVDWTEVKPGGRMSQAWADADHLWGRVRRVELSELLVPVYDLEVEDDHSFIADGFVVHNCCQRLELPDTEVDTWSVEYVYGQGPPPGGIAAAASLGCQLSLARQPETVGQCRLPKRVTSVVRQGVSMTLLDPLTLFSEGRTGLEDVDLWLASVMVGNSRRPATVWRPDLRKQSTRHVGT